MPQSLKEVPVVIEDEMKKSYIDYAMSVIVARALPDVRDGLKPVQRRILVAMDELGLAHNKQFRKSAKISGDVNGNYHPHGTTAIYDAMVRMAQDFSLRYPLVDGQGNFGSIDGDSAAAERYTEARMTRPAEDLLADLKKETVEFVPKEHLPPGGKEELTLRARRLLDQAALILVGREVREDEGRRFGEGCTDPLDGLPDAVREDGDHRAGGETLPKRDVVHGCQLLAALGGQQDLAGGGRPSGSVRAGTGPDDEQARNQHQQPEFQVVHL